VVEIDDENAPVCADNGAKNARARDDFLRRLKTLCDLAGQLNSRERSNELEAEHQEHCQCNATTNSSSAAQH
jgi:hypothetical protein